MNKQTREQHKQRTDEINNGQIHQGRKTTWRNKEIKQTTKGIKHTPDQ